MMLLLILLILLYNSTGEYNSKQFEDMCERQKHFVLDTWLVKHAWVNPSMIQHPDEPNKVVMVWR